METTTPEAAKPLRERTRLGEWIADPAANALYRGEETVRVEPRSMDVLMTLAARAHTVVSREELFAAAWPGTVVGDEALTQAITKLRRALGDDPRSPTYIETISKRGYRLLAPVQPADASSTAVPPLRPIHAAPRRRWALALAGSFVVLAAAVALFITTRTPVADAEDAAAARSEAWVALMVLPFEYQGAEPAHAYLASGIGDALMAELGRLAGLRVIAAPHANATDAAKHARYLLTGSVQRDATTLRISARLVDTATREQIWTERFERPATDLFAVQDEIVRQLARALPAKVGESERQRVARRHTRSLEAYDHFLRAQALFLARGTRENEEARALYRKAIEIDPRFARAYAGLAMTLALEHRLEGRDDPARLDRALELAESARLIDPELAEVHWALGFVHAQARRHDQAIASLERTIALNPSFADAYALMAGIHTYRGQPARSIPLMRSAMRLHPEGGYLYFLILGRAYLFENDTEQALINLREALARNPSDLESRVYHAAALVASGDAGAARWEAEEIRGLERDFSLDTWLASYPLTSAPHKQRLREWASGASL